MRELVFIGTCVKCAAYRYVDSWAAPVASEVDDEPDASFKLLEAKSREMLSKQQAYTKGSWNINSVQVMYDVL